MVESGRQLGRLPWAGWVAVFIGTATAGAAGQPTVSRHDPDSFVNQQRAVERRLREAFDVERGRALFDWGGWYGAYLFLFDDGVESSRTLRRSDLRLWGRLALDRGAHELYARTRVSLLDFNDGDSYDGDDDDVEGPNLERGWYRFDLAKAMGAGGDRATDYNLVLTAGRDLVQFGGGVTLATPLDHVSLRSTYGSVETTALAGRTVGSSLDFDPSRTARRTRRNFFGVEVKHLGLDRHEPFAYALWQRDRNREARFQPFQRHDYNSFYLGVGATGEIRRRLRYEAECVYESGRSFGDRQFLRDNDISAWAIHTELEYLFAGAPKARASIEYLFGSGDSDRFASPTNSAVGNRGHFKDSGFIAFGYDDTGLSFAPRYGNLHMWRTGASCYPWPAHPKLRHLELGTDWYVYHKHHRSAAVSDPTANRRSGFLGWEMDYFANYRMTADLAWTARWGLFFPGPAFSDRGTRTFFLVGMTWSF